MEYGHNPEKPRRRRLETTRAMGKIAIDTAIDTVLTALVSGDRVLFTDAWWQRKYTAAETYMAERRTKQNGSVLLIATAQHPLDGDKPGKEFASRLAACADRAKALSAKGIPVEIYVPGSQHVHEGKVDPLSLSAAGVNFLRSCDLPPNVTLHGDDLNQTYKGNEGVYNSADEAFVSAQYFIHNAELNDIEVFCSSGQQPRWELHAVANGILPHFSGVTPEGIKMYHTQTGRSEDKVTAYTRRFDPTWQSPSSLLGQGSRLIRRPK